MSNQQQMEKRTTAAKIELRTVNGKTLLSGYAAVFSEWSQDLGGFREKLRYGCFTRCLQERQDTKMLFNHDMSAIVGRVKNSTLSLREDLHGLYFECVLPATTVGKDLRENVSSGLVDACSFGFTIADGGDEWGTDIDENGRTFTCRTINAISNLWDTSCVCAPAYLGTSCAVSERALEKARAFTGKHSAVPSTTELLDRSLRLRLDAAGRDIARFPRN